MSNASRQGLTRATSWGEWVRVRSTAGMRRRSEAATTTLASLERGEKGEGEGEKGEVGKG